MGAGAGIGAEADDGAVSPARWAAARAVGQGGSGICQRGAGTGGGGSAGQRDGGDGGGRGKDWFAEWGWSWSAIPLSGTGGQAASGTERASEGGAPCVRLNFYHRGTRSFCAVVGRF